MKRKSFKFEYKKNYFFACVRKIVGVNNFKRKRYYGRKIRNPSKTNDFIRESISSGERFFIARLGDVECRLLLNQEQVDEGMIERVPEKIRKTAFTNAGMFTTTDEGIKTFFDYCTKGLNDVTGICVWFNQMEDYIVDKYSPKSELLSLDGLESYLYEKPWTSALKGKKVLVINPFAESIIKQFNSRDKLFKNKETLPDFELHTFKSFYTLPNEKNPFSSWEEALLKMRDECLKIDFDIAIIGCGSYGLPLGSLLFKEGKNVIHAGGVTQIYFGIRGKRWDERKYMKKYINEHWIRPTDDEKPKSSDKIENGCYW